MKVYLLPNKHERQLFRCEITSYFRLMWSSLIRGFRSGAEKSSFYERSAKTRAMMIIDDDKNSSVGKQNRGRRFVYVLYVRRNAVSSRENGME